MKTLVAVAAKFAGFAGLLLAGSGDAIAQSMLTIRSPSGESRTFTPDNSRFTLEGNSRSLYFTAGINVKMAGHWWEIKLEAPEGETLRPGRYLNVGCTGWARTGRAAGLGVTDNNPVCKLGNHDAVWGSFDIRQISFAEDGRIKSVEATFVQRLESPAAPALTGTFRYDASPLQFQVAAGRNFPWGAISQDNYGDSSFFALSGDLTGLVYEASVPRDHWRIRIAPPTGRVLAPGRYATSDQADSSHAQMIVYRDLQYSPRCASTGELKIEDLRLNDAGQVDGLRATFLMRCNGYPAPLRGTIRHNL